MLWQCNAWGCDVSNKREYIGGFLSGCIHVDLQSWFLYAESNSGKIVFGEAQRGECSKNPSAIGFRFSNGFSAFGKNGSLSVLLDGDVVDVETGKRESIIRLEEEFDFNFSANGRAGQPDGSLRPSVDGAGFAEDFLEDFV